MPPLDRSREYARGCLALADSGAPLCVVDLELTSPYRDGQPLPLIWSVGAVRLVGWRIAGQVSHVVRVGVRLDDRIARLCGVPADVAERSGVDIGVALRDLSTVGDDAVWVGHAIDFHDAPVLREAYAAAGMALPPALAPGAGRKIDTYRLARGLLPQPAKGDRSLSLGGLCERFGVDRYGGAMHGALTDAHMCARVLPALLALARVRG